MKDHDAKFLDLNGDIVTQNKLFELPLMIYSCRKYIYYDYPKCKLESQHCFMNLLCVFYFLEDHAKFIGLNDDIVTQNR